MPSLASSSGSTAAAQKVKAVFLSVVPDQMKPQRIQGNYLTHEDDISEGIAMARLVERLQETPALQHVLADTPLTPLSQMSDDEVVDDLKQRVAQYFTFVEHAAWGPVREHRWLTHGSEFMA